MVCSSINTEVTFFYSLHQSHLKKVILQIKYCIRFVFTVYCVQYIPTLFCPGVQNERCDWRALINGVQVIILHKIICILQFYKLQYIKRQGEKMRRAESAVWGVNDSSRGLGRDNQQCPLSNHRHPCPRCYYKLQVYFKRTSYSTL